MTLNNRILLSLVAFVAAAAAFYMLALKPKREEAAKLQTSISEMQSELTAARQLLATNQQAQQGYQQAYASVVRLGKAVPADDDVRSLVVQLEAAAKASKVDFRTIDVGDGGTSSSSSGTAPAMPLPPGTTVGPAGFPVMPFKFQFTGNFLDLGKFFGRLQTFVRLSNERLAVKGRLLTVESIELKPDATGFPRIRATVGASSYLVPPIEGSTGGATPEGPAGATPAAAAGTAPAAPSTATTTGAIR